MISLLELINNNITIFISLGFSTPIVGTDNNDQLNGIGVNNNIILGEKGNDTITGASRNDLIFGDGINGGDGKDRIQGQNGTDVLYGGGKNDTLNGGEGNDVLLGWKNDDSLDGGGGSDRLYGGADRDTLNGGNDRDNLYGLGGNDNLTGGKGDDKLFGDGEYPYGEDVVLDLISRLPELFAFFNTENNSPGDDLLNGGEGKDKLDGNRGNDILNGYGESRNEIDTLNGGAGRDTFILGDNDIIFYQNSGRNDFGVIEDLTNQDKIQLNGRPNNYRLEKNLNYAGRSALDTAIFTTRGELIGVVQDNVSLINSLNSSLFIYV